MQLVVCRLNRTNAHFSTSCSCSLASGWNFLSIKAYQTYRLSADHMPDHAPIAHRKCLLSRLNHDISPHSLSPFTASVNLMRHEHTPMTWPTCRRHIPELDCNLLLSHGLRLEIAQQTWTTTYQVLVSEHEKHQKPWKVGYECAKYGVNVALFGSGS